ncbi:MAG TPA: hypothetical protein VEV42_10720 [Pyrinomonadaceae bacterium]|nr:hypothetical protein [Pyrinomonadaceae bacterium]
MQKKRRHTGVLVRELFTVLLDHPEGLSIDAALKTCLPGASKADGRRLGEQLLRGCVAPMKAGWLVSDGNGFTVSAQGKVAYQTYSDPDDFLLHASKHSLRGWISVHFPEPYFFLGKLRDQFASEYRVAKRIGIKNLLEKAIGTPASWQEVLPVQSARRIEIPNLELTNLESFLSELKQSGLSYGAGGHAVYLPPETIAATPFRELSNYYPSCAGLKIVKHPGGLAESVYVYKGEGESRLHLKLIHNLRHLTLVANLLHVNRVGPKLYDLVELQCNNNLWTAFVIEHVAKPVTSMDVCENGIETIRGLEQRNLVKIILPSGFDDQEFQCPDCSGNAFMTVNGEFRYIDFQNFALTGYEDYLKSVALEAAEASHFGDKSILRGGRYLYQSVPGLNLPGKRNVETRVEALGALMNSAGVAVENRLVLDVGCNIGMMMAQYLKLGALWCHGWDQEVVVPHTEKLLYALGCTRFSTTGGVISVSTDLKGALAPHLKQHLNGCVISYLAVRGHINWLNALKEIPWAFMIYEGHEGETTEQSLRYIEEFKKTVPLRIAAQGEYADGDSEPRTVAILIREVSL